MRNRSSENISDLFPNLFCEELFLNNLFGIISKSIRNEKKQSFHSKGREKYYLFININFPFSMLSKFNYEINSISFNFEKKSSNRRKDMIR